MIKKLVNQELPNKKQILLQEGGVLLGQGQFRYGMFSGCCGVPECPQ